MRLFRTIACLAFTAALAGAASAEVPREDVRAFMEKSGMVEQLSEAVAQIRETFSEQIAGQIPSDLVKPMDEVIVAAWSAKRLLDAVETGLAETVTPDEVAAANSFIETALGQRLVAAEIASGSKDAVREIEMKKAELVAQLSGDKSRMSIAERIDATLHGTDISVAVAMNLVRAMVEGSAGGNASEAQVETFLSMVRPKVLEDTRISMLARFAYEYREFSLDELSTYAEFLETNPAKAINGVLFAVANDHFAVVGGEIGNAMGTLLRQKRG